MHRQLCEEDLERMMTTCIELMHDNGFVLLGRPTAHSILARPSLIHDHIDMSMSLAGVRTEESWAAFHDKRRQQLFRRLPFLKDVAIDWPLPQESKKKKQTDNAADREQAKRWIKKLPDISETDADLYASTAPCNRFVVLWFDIKVGKNASRTARDMIQRYAQAGEAILVAPNNFTPSADPDFKEQKIRHYIHQQLMFNFTHHRLFFRPIPLSNTEAEAITKQFKLLKCHMRLLLVESPEARYYGLMVNQVVFYNFIVAPSGPLPDFRLVV